MTEIAEPTLPARPRLKRTVEPFPASDGHVYLLRGAAEADFVLRDAPPEVRDLLALLRSNADPVAGLRERLAARGHDVGEADLRAALGDLSAAGLLADATAAPHRYGLSAEALERYDRQLIYFADVAPGGCDPLALQRRLASARVVVIGVGGLGSWTMTALACAGVGALVGVDDDTVSVSNLNRQLLFRRSDVGRPKVEVAAEALSAYNPEIEVSAVRRRVASAADARAAVAGADFVVATADWPMYEIGRWINAACFGAAIPWISASQFPPRIRIGPTYVPGETGCLECQEAAGREAFPLYDELAAWREANPSEAATLGPASGIIGTALAMEIVHHLTGACPPATTGAGAIVDLRTWAVEWERVPRRPDCPVCGGAG